MITNIAAYDKWKQENLSTYVKDLYKKDAALARSLGTIQLPPENPKQQAFMELSARHRQPAQVALKQPVEKKSLYTSWSTLFARKPVRQDTDTPVPKDEPKRNKNP